MVFFQFLSAVSKAFLKGKTRVTLTFMTGLSKEIVLAFEFCRKDIFKPVLMGFPGKFLAKLMSELKLLLKYSGLIGSKEFLELLSEIKLTLDEKSQNGLDFGAFRCDQTTVTLFCFRLVGNPLLNC